MLQHASLIFTQAALLPIGEQIERKQAHTMLFAKLLCLLLAVAASNSKGLGARYEVDNLYDVV